jgi:hypothetical protein
VGFVLGFEIGRLGWAHVVLDEAVPVGLAVVLMRHEVVPVAPADFDVAEGAGVAVGVGVGFGLGCAVVVVSDGIFMVGGTGPRGLVGGPVAAQNPVGFMFKNVMVFAERAEV